MCTYSIFHTSITYIDKQKKKSLEKSQWVRFYIFVCKHKLMWYWLSNNLISPWYCLNIFWKCLYLWFCSTEFCHSVFMSRTTVININVELNAGRPCYYDSFGQLNKSFKFRIWPSYTRNNRSVERGTMDEKARFRWRVLVTFSTHWMGRGR